MLSDPGFRELISLPLPAPVLQGLYRAGFTTVGEVAGLTADRLSNVCGVGTDVAISALRVLKRYSELTYTVADGLPKFLFNIPTAYDLLMSSRSQLTDEMPSTNAVVTMCQSFDNLLDGGFPTDRLTELCGEPGVGKTQFSIQACLTAQLPRWFGGLQGESVFIDTEGNFVPRRARQMAEALVKHCRRHLVLQDGVLPSNEDFDEYCPTVDNLLSGIHYIRATDHVQLLATCQRLDQFCEQHPKIRFIVVDSIALPFRYDFDDIVQRNRILVFIAQILCGLAVKQHAAIVLTNQITTRVDSKSRVDIPDSSTSHLVPALGESWGHICSVRVFLTRISDTRRQVRLLKHPGRPFGTGLYQITSGGIRDCFDR